MNPLMKLDIFSLIVKENVTQAQLLIQIVQTSTWWVQTG
jgi:hypothetical protein